ncbi:hypothetical protein [Nonomuraea sp. NPDC049784]|uniref:hypothetical protein n=1 Tax=Nonomuraea sp. NPDC049784 TaxID=3154361 RepID=UPI0033D357F7
MNTEAEEIVSCIIGKIRLYLRPEWPGRQGEEEEIRLTAGTAVIVPRGRWHRIQLDIPGPIMNHHSAMWRPFGETRRPPLTAPAL